MIATAEQLSLTNLARIGRLLDEAIDLADAAGESLLGAEIAQVLHVLDTRLAAARSDPLRLDPGGIGPGGGGAAEG